MDTKNIDGKKVLMMKMPTASVYALTYAAKAAGDITIKVTQIINRGDVNNDGMIHEVTRAYSRVAFRYSGQKLFFSGQNFYFSGRNFCFSGRNCNN